MLHFNSELSRYQLVSISEPSPVGIIIMSFLTLKRNGGESINIIFLFKKDSDHWYIYISYIKYTIYKYIWNITMTKKIY